MKVDKYKSIPRYRITTKFFSGNMRETRLVKDIAEIMNVDGILYGNDLIDFINGCAAIGDYMGIKAEVRGRKLTEIDIDKVTKYILKDVYRIMKNKQADEDSKSTADKIDNHINGKMKG